MVTRAFFSTEHFRFLSVLRQCVISNIRLAANCGYMDTWHATRKPVLFVGLSLKGISHGGGQGDALRIHGCGKLMPLAGSYLVWEGSLNEYLQGMAAGNGIIGWVRWCIPWHMPLMIDWLTFGISIILFYWQICHWSCSSSPDEHMKCVVWRRA